MATGDDGLRGQRFQRALAHHRAGRLREAEGVYREMLLADPRDADALHMLGVLASQVGRNDVAAGLLREVVAIMPGNGGLHAELGEMLRRAGRMEEAETECRRAVELSPKLFDGHFNLGVVLLGLKKLEPAAASYRRALAIDGRHAGAHYNLGNALKELGDWKGAEESYRRALELAPGYAEARGNLGLALQRKGDLAGAADCFDRVIAQRPDDAVAHNNLGNALREMGRTEQALASYRRAVAIDPGDGAAHNNLGKLLHDMGRREEAIGHYERAIAVSPERGEAYQNLGMALGQAGREKEAEARFRQAMERGVVSEAARFHMAAMTGLESPAAAPAEHVVKLFAEMAPTFDERLVTVLKYRGPEVLHEAVMAAAGADARFSCVLDLGCGTGLCGAIFKQQSARIVGVDLSPAMAEKARDRNIYDELIVGDIGEYMAKCAETFDLVLAADVLIYMGDLEIIFAGAARVIKSGGWFGFTAEAGDVEDFRLQRSRRYTHSQGYLRRLAEKHGFVGVSLAPSTIRQEAGKDVGGWTVMLRKAV